MTDDCFYIDTPAALSDLCRRIRDSRWICVDTEFMREKSYFPQLCLLQVATADAVACIDPLTIADLDPLLDILYDPSITKVMHAARQDLEIFFHLRGELPKPLFDTQIAAALLHHTDQIGYGTLVERMLGVQLDKAHTRTDWCMRPLDPEQLRYAADDVRYLARIYVTQREILEQQGRLHWLDEDFAELTDTSLYAVEPMQAWCRIKEARPPLKGVQLAVLQALAAWREERALQRNKPRRWILRDEILTDLARAMPTTRDGLAKIRGLEPALLDKVGNELLRVIDRSRQAPCEAWPEPEPRLILSPAQEALVDAMMALVRLRAHEQGISPAMLATRRDLERVVTGAKQVSVLRGWRGAMVGHDLQNLLKGELCLCVRDGLLLTQPVAASAEEPEYSN
ncbi:MAG: ribonuclease D [Gammaproteobacteria bacterium]